MSDIFVDNIKHQSSQGSGTITLGASGEKITTATGAEFSQVTGQNYPGFHVRLNSSQNISSATGTKIAFDTVTYDSASCWDSTNYRWTPNQSGKYMIYGQIYASGSSTDTVDRGYIYCYQNGSTIVTLQQQYGNTTSEGNVWSPSYQIVHELNGTSDYIECWGFIQVVSGTPKFTGSSGQHRCCFGAYRIGA